MHKDFALCFLDSTFSHATEEMLLWKNRLPKLRGKIQDSNADIVCLQEISLGSFVDDFGGYFQSKHGYDYRLNPSCGSADNGIGGDFTTAIMFKSSKFECVHEDSRSRAIILLLTNKLEQSQCVHCRESQRICLYHSFFVVNVHLESKSDRESARMNALKSILKRIRFCLSEKLKINNVDKEAANVRRLTKAGASTGTTIAAASDDDSVKRAAPNWGGVSGKVSKILTEVKTRSHNELVVDSLKYYLNYLEQHPLNIYNL